MNPAHRVHTHAPIQNNLHPASLPFRRLMKQLLAKVTNTLTKNPIDSPIYYAAITLQ